MASAETAHGAVEPAPKKAKGSGKQSDAAMGSAAAAGSAAVSVKPAVRLHADALSCVFAFCTLKQLLKLARVSREYRVAALRTPVIKALRSVAALRGDHLTAVSEIASQIVDSYRAEERLPGIIAKQKEMFRELECMSVSAPLLALLQSARLVRHKAKFDAAKKDEGSGGTAFIQVQLPSMVSAAGASSAANVSTAAASTSTLQLRVSWLFGYEQWESSNEDKWTIAYKTANGGKLEKLFHMLTFLYRGQHSNEKCDAKPLAKLLRERGILLGSRRQQGNLLYSFVVTLYALATTSPMFENSIEVVQEGCDAACGYSMQTGPEETEAKEESEEEEGEHRDDEEEDGTAGEDDGE